MPHFGSGARLRCLSLALSSLVLIVRIGTVESLKLAGVSSSEWNSRIPPQLLLTGKPDSPHDMPTEIKENIINTLKLVQKVPNMRVKWLGDEACHQYIGKYFDEELLSFFDHASPGYYRGDICRAAVLSHEGGFYSDVDVQLAVPLSELVDGNTTFMSVYSVNGDIFNGLLAVEPNSAIMANHLNEIRKWYRGETKQEGLMGTKTLLRGLLDTLSESCPDIGLTDMRQQLQFRCKDQSIRLYHEQDLNCFMKPGVEQPAECPPERREADLGLRLGFFVPGARQFIGWPRFHNCRNSGDGCGSGGHLMLQTGELLHLRREIY